MAYFSVFCSKNILTELVGYQQRMSMYQDKILLCELYSLSCSCFRWCGGGAIVYGICCFVLHV